MDYIECKAKSMDKKALILYKNNIQLRNETQF